jgi:DNA repair protein SbcC/Rad50
VANDMRTDPLSLERWYRDTQLRNIAFDKCVNAVARQRLSAMVLALHLSVPSRMPWLVLDDPVQSMDDVHIAQFAALQRTPSKGMGRQLVVSVHERALFDYLTLELSPAFPGDSLISVEITRNFNGDAVAVPQVFSYKDDRAIAA